MLTYSFTLAGARLAYLLTITRVDETVERVTNYGKAITIGDYTWQPEPGLEIGDYIETNKGILPSFSFKVAMRAGGAFTKEDINNGLFERAEAVLYITDARTPSLDDEETRGLLKGDVEFDLDGNAQFEFLNKFGLERDIFVRKYSIEDDVDFGDPRRSKIPTFPTVDPTSDDLSDVERDTVLTLGERRRFRYDANDNPADYRNVYWEVTNDGITGASDPDVPSTAPDVARNEALTLGDLRRFEYAPGDYRDVVWEVTDDGTTHATDDPVAPSDTPGDTVTDGTVEFTVRDAYAAGDVITDGTVEFTVRNAWARAFQVASIIDENHIIITVTEPRADDEETWFAPGLIVMRSGTMKNRASDVDAWDGISQISLVVPIANQFEVGDWGEISPDYDQTLDMTVAKYENANNFRGFPHLTGARLATSTFILGTTVDNWLDGDDPGGGGGGGGEGGGYEGFAVEFEPGSD